MFDGHAERFWFLSDPTGTPLTQVFDERMFDYGRMIDRVSSFLLLEFFPNKSSNKGR